MKKLFVLMLFLACVAGYWGCAARSDVVTLDSRLTDMELRDAERRKERERLRSEVEGRNLELRKQSAGLRAILEEMNEEIRLLNGQIEELEHSINQRQKLAQELAKKREETLDRLSKISDQNTDRIARLEQYLNLETSKKSVVVATPGVQTQKQPSSENEIYQSAKQAFDQGDSDAARQGFQELIRRYPDSGNADNAQFWIGEIYYREKWYEKAILEYQKVIEKYPTGNKVPAALLKQGLAFSNIGDKANSRLIFEELIRKYPKSTEAKVAAEKLKTIK
jgi:tol-pal system protein YbgF